MGFMRNAMKAGIAKKVWDQVRKPENQARARQLVDRATAKRGGRSPGAPSTRRS